MVSAWRVSPIHHTEGAEAALNCNQRVNRSIALARGIFCIVSICLGEEREWANMKKHMVFIYHVCILDYVYHRIICISRSMTGKQTTPFSSL